MFKMIQYDVIRIAYIISECVNMGYMFSFINLTWVNA